jgi:hypothetical protein
MSAGVSDSSGVRSRYLPSWCAARGGAVDAQLARRGGAQEPVERRSGPELAGELGAGTRIEPVAVGDRLGEAGDDVVADRRVAARLVGVVADDEPVTSDAVVKADLLDAQVAGDGLVGPCRASAAAASREAPAASRPGCSCRRRVADSGGSVRR